MKLGLANFLRQSLRELARECIQLAQDEVVLFLRRLARDARPLRKPAIAIALGALLAFFTLILLITAAVLGLAEVLPAWAAALVVALVLGAGAAWFLRHVAHPSWSELMVLPPEPVEKPRLEKP